jgi:hypothetical protein
MWSLYHTVAFEVGRNFSRFKGCRQSSWLCLNFQNPHGVAPHDPEPGSCGAAVNYRGSTWLSRPPIIPGMAVRSWVPVYVERLLPLGVVISMTNPASSGAPMIQAGTSQLIDEMVSMMWFLSGGCATGLWRGVSIPPQQRPRDRTSPSQPVGMFRAPALGREHQSAVPHPGCQQV